MTDAFAGIRILDFTQLEQGPSATQVLADFGADVIKVERPGVGEIGRSQQPTMAAGFSPHWSATNRNKRSITVDVKSSAGRALILDLARDADIVASNFRPGVMDRLGLGWEELSAINPRIIVAYATGYGLSGPYAYRRGQDLAAQAVGGLMALTGTEDSGPVPTGTFMIDYLASMQFAQGMMIALAARERTGRGQMVETNLLNAAITSHLQEAATYLNTGRGFPRPTAGVAHPGNTALYGYYEAADGLWFALIGEYFVDRPWQRAARACGLSDDDINDPRLQSVEGLLEHTRETTRLIADAVAKYPRDEIMARFEAEDVLVAPVNDYGALFTDPQVVHNGLVIEGDVDGVGRVKWLGMPITLSDTPARLRAAPPKIGQHNEEVLTAAGLSDEHISALKTAGVIGSESDRERLGEGPQWS
jgi:formyl-CoA transferase